MKKIVFLCLTCLLILSVQAQIDFKAASKEEVAKYYSTLPASTALKDFRATASLNPEIKVIDADSATDLYAGGRLLYHEKWTLSAYTQDIRPTGIFHGLVGPDKTYVLIVSATGSRGLVFIKTGNNYGEICSEDIAWVRGKLAETKDLNNGQIIIKILQAPSRNLDPSYLVIDLKTKKPEVFD